MIWNNTNEKHCDKCCKITKLIFDEMKLGILISMNTVMIVVKWMFNVYLKIKNIIYYLSFHMLLLIIL